MKKFKPLSVVSFVFAFILAFSVATAAHATTYYVSSSTGNDTNTGTSSTAPWATLSKVNTKVSSFAAGDSILFKRGDTFLGTQTQAGNGVITWASKSGTASAPITIGNYGTGALPIMDLAENSTNSNIPLEDRNFFLIRGSNYIVIDGLNFTDTNWLAQHPNDPDKKQFGYIGVAVRMENSGSTAFHDNTIKNCTISYTGMGIVVDFGNFITITGNSITDLQNFVSTDGGNGEDYGANALTIMNGSTDNTITYNYFKGIWAHSQDFGYNGGVMEMYGDVSRNKFMYNTVIDSGGISEFGASYSTDITADNLYAYNLFINNGALSYVNMNGQFAVDARNIQYFNNTIIEDGNDRFVNVGATGAEGLVKDDNLFSYSGSPATSNKVYNLKNNIFYVTKTSGSNQFRIMSGSNSYFTHENNVYHLLGGATLGSGFSVNASETSTTANLFGSTLSTSGDQWGATNLNANNAAYNLLSTATTAIDKGVNLGLTMDKKGATVPQGSAPDIGAYEYGSGGGGTDTAAPTNVAITAPATGTPVVGTVTLTASASDNVAVANVSYYLDGVFQSSDTTAPYTASWNSTTVANGSHTWYVVAADTSGNFTTSPTLTYTVNNAGIDGTAPVVSIASPAAGTSVNGSVLISANASDNIGVVGVTFKVDGTTIGTEDMSSPYVSSAFWVTTGYTNGSHTVTATARDAAGNTSTATNVVTVSNTVQQNIPSVPTGLTTTTDSQVRVFLTWSASTGSPAGYYVYRDGVRVANLTTTSFTDTAVAPNTTYGYTVSAYNSAGESARSVTATATTPVVQSGNPSVPTGLVAAVVSGSQINLSWSPSSGNVGGYEIYRNGVDINHTTGGGSTTYADSGLTSGTTYTYAISAFNVAETFESAQSTQVSATAGTVSGPTTYKTTAKINIRLNPTTSLTGTNPGTILGQQQKNAVGTLIQIGSVNANGYTWVKLDFPTGVDGWVVTRYLVLTSGAGARLSVLPTTGTVAGASIGPISDQIQALFARIAAANTTAEANSLLKQIQALQGK